MLLFMYKHTKTREGQSNQEGYTTNGVANLDMHIHII